MLIPFKNNIVFNSCSILNHCNPTVITTKLNRFFFSSGFLFHYFRCYLFCVICIYCTVIYCIISLLAISFSFNHYSVSSIILWYYSLLNAKSKAIKKTQLKFLKKVLATIFVSLVNHSPHEDAYVISCKHRRRGS